MFEIFAVRCGVWTLCENPIYPLPVLGGKMKSMNWIGPVNKTYDENWNMQANVTS
jgi:hypothetical protein